MGNTRSKKANKTDKKGKNNDIDDIDTKQHNDCNDIDEKEFKSKLEKLDIWPHFILMGDSVLDNIAWIEDQNKRLDVEKQLNLALKQYNKSWKCVNLAVDGNTTKTLIHSLNFYNLEKDKQIQPKRFKSLQYYLESNDIDLEKERPIIVLSVGGNDVLGYMYHIKQLSKNVLNDMAENEFLKSYREILDILITDCKCDVLLVFTYEPHIRFCTIHNIERKELLNIIQWAALNIFSIGYEYKLPIIDLCRTANPYNKNHFSSVSAIEPNETTGSFVTNLILKILYDFEWSIDNGRCSKIYYGQSDDGNGIKIERNTENVRNNYLKSKTAIHPFQKVKK